MASGGVGHDPDCVDKLTDISSPGSDSRTYKGSRNVISGGLLTNLLNCDNFDEEEDFVRLFTSDPTPPVSSSYESEESLIATY